MYSKNALLQIVPFKIKPRTHRDLFVTDPIKYAEQSIIELQEQLTTCKTAKKAAKLNGRISFWLQVLAFNKVQNEKEAGKKGEPRLRTVADGEPHAGPKQPDGLVREDNEPALSE